MDEGVGEDTGETKEVADAVSERYAELFEIFEGNDATPSSEVVVSA